MRAMPIKFNRNGTYRKKSPPSKKGLGGFVLHHVDEDIEDLGISSVTVNLLFDEFMRNAPSDATVTFSYHGHDFYLNKAKLEEFDRTLKYASDHHVIVAAILLVSNADKFDDPKLGKIFEHPDYHPAGIYDHAESHRRNWVLSIIRRSLTSWLNATVGLIKNMAVFITGSCITKLMPHGFGPMLANKPH